MLFPAVTSGKNAKKLLKTKIGSGTLALFSLEEPSKCQRLHEVSLRDRRRVKAFASGGWEEFQKASE